MRYVAVPVGGLFIGGLVLFGPWTTEPEIPRWACIYALASLSAVWLAMTGLRDGAARLGLMDAAIVALFLWAGASLVWTTDWRAGAYALTQAAALLAIYLGVRHAPKAFLFPILRWTVPASIVIVLGLLAAQPWLEGMKIRYGGPLVMLVDENLYGGFWLQNFVTEFLLIAAPLLAAFKLRRFIALPLMAAALASTVLVKGYLEWPVFMLFAAVMCSRLLGLKDRRDIVVIAALLVVAGIWAFTEFPDVRSSFLPRFEIWINTLVLVAQAPFAGHGLASFQGQYDGVMAAHLDLIPGLGQNVYSAGSFAGSAHNEFLQLWAELGLVGIGLAALFVREIFKSRVRIVGIGGSLMAAAALSMFGFPLQNPATALLVVVTLGIVARGQRQWKKITITTIPASSIAAVSVAAWAWTAPASMQASHDMSLFRAWWDADKLRAAAYNFDAYAAFPMDSFIRRQLSASVNALVNSGKGEVVMDDKTADALYEVGRGAAPYSVEIRLARMQYLFNSGRWGEPELGALLDDLRRRNPYRPEIWVADAFYGAFTGNFERMSSSARMAMQLRPDIETLNPAFGSIVSILNKGEHG
jgi:hypothetical protein